MIYNIPIPLIPIYQKPIKIDIDLSIPFMLNNIGFFLDEEKRDFNIEIHTKQANCLNPRYKFIIQKDNYLLYNEHDGFLFDLDFTFDIENQTVLPIVTITAVGMNNYSCNSNLGIKYFPFIRFKSFDITTIN